MRDDLTLAVEEITNDSKNIKSELEKSLEINRAKEEIIKNLESELKTAEHEKTLNEILESENQKLKQNSENLLDENEKISSDLESAMAEITQSRNEILELNQRILITKVIFLKIFKILTPFLEGSRLLFSKISPLNYFFITNIQGPLKYFCSIIEKLECSPIYKFLRLKII